MSVLTYTPSVSDRPLAWLRGEVKTPPCSAAARLEAGELLRRRQRGEKLGLPHSRPLSSVGPRCHELRVLDAGANWRIIYRLDPDAVVIVEVFSKQTAQLPKTILDACRGRLRRYDATIESEERQ